MSRGPLSVNGCSCPAGTYDYPNAVHEPYCALTLALPSDAIESVEDMARSTERIARIAELRVRTQDARCRARGRVMLQRFGVTEDELPDGVTLWGAGCISRPDELLPYERVAVIALGRQLARKYGW